jgi:hypothetical protein
VRLVGRGWVPDRRVVNAQAGVTVAAAPLLVRAAGTLVVYWKSEQDLRELDASIGSCNAADVAPQVEISVFKCPPLRPADRGVAAECVLLRREKVDAFFGSMAFEDVVPGMYRAEMRYGKLPPVSETAHVRPLRVDDLRILASYSTLYGSVTRGGEPLDEKVRIHFTAGVGFAPAETDEYRAVFHKSSGERSEMAVTVAACDGAPEAVVLGDQPMRPHARFNIDIPVNELTVRVTDTFTGETLRGASVKLDVMSLMRYSRVAFSAEKKTDQDGTAVWSSVPVRELHLTVTHGGYEKRNVEPFPMKKSGAQTVDVQLVPSRGSRARILSDRPFESGAVVWFSPAGSETEHVELAADGTFVYTRSHAADETMAVVSASHPLWVQRAPAASGRESLTLPFPAAPPVAFDVWIAAAIAPRESREIGVAIGGVRVPQPVLAYHQTLRHDPPLLRGSGPQHFRDLLATGTIEVLLGPRPEEVASRSRGLDVFALPHYADVPRQRLEPGVTDVVFTVK